MKDKEDKEKDGGFSSDPDIQKQADNRKIVQKAIAFYKRGKKANIPTKHLRINSDEFSKMLDVTYIKENAEEYKELFGEDYKASNQVEFASYIYKNADKLLDMDYIVIDGGNAEARRRTGFALLFRLILCDKWATYKECTELAHIFGSIEKGPDAIHRNAVARQLKAYDIVFFAEFYKKLMSVHFNEGSFFDEVLIARKSAKMPSIISFAENIMDENKIKNKDYGVTFADLSWQLKPGKNNLRIKVVPYESK